VFLNNLFMKWKLLVTVLFSVLSSNFVHSQNLMGGRWLFGSGRGVEAIFSDTSRPFLRIRYTNGTPGFPFYHTKGHSNICDSASGKLLFSCNGMVLYDSTGAVMQNGDSLVGSKYYTHNFFPNAAITQGSLILPRGNDGNYYVFIAGVSDSMYNICWTNPNSTQAPFDRLQYNIVDMNQNGGLGRVVVKNKILLQGGAMHKVMMQACRHSNGRDWWLLKQGEYDTNRIYRFLVKADTVEGPWVQNFAEPKYPSYDLSGQFAFSPDGTKFASIQGKGKMNKLFLADFDRCTGELTNPKVINIPIDSTTYANLDNAGNLDSINTGVCFSPNGQFVYISKRYNIYQYEYGQADSGLAWYRVQHSADTTLQKFSYYAHLGLGLDNRIYIGNVGELYPQMSVIDKPDIKGAGCQFCRKCMRLSDTSGQYNGVGFTSPPNMPNYNLGAAPGPCWPLGQSENEKQKAELLEVYPNPSSTVFYIKNAKGKKKAFYSITGQLLFSTYADEVDVSGWSKGVYVLRAGARRAKLIIE